jgi:hypothetical protein
MVLKLRDMGPYDQATNSCWTHAYNVLNAGGASIASGPPASYLEQVKIMLRLFKDT